MSYLQIGSRKPWLFTPYLFVKSFSLFFVCPDLFWAVRAILVNSPVTLGKLQTRTAGYEKNRNKKRFMDNHR